MSPPSQETILTRIAALERQNHRLRWMAVGLALLVVAGVSLSFVNLRAQANAPAPKLKAEKLVLHDESGKERIVLKVDKNDPRIQFFNSDGKLATIIGSGSLLFCDSKEIPRLEIYAGDTEAGFTLMNEKSVPRVVIRTKGNPLLGFRDDKGRQILEVLKDGPKLTFFDKEGKPLFTKP